MYKIGVTGGIASGKTTLSKFVVKFKHVAMLNLDLIAHKLYDNDHFLRQAIATRFGPTAIKTLPNGRETVDRQVLGRAVFSSRENLQALNAIVHPQVKKYLEFHIQSLVDLPKELRPDVIFVEGAVIIEGGWVKYFDEIWSTMLPKGVAVERVQVRNKNLSREQAERRVQLQINDTDRMRIAKFWYDSSKPFEENAKAICAQMERLRKEGILREVAKV